MQAQTRRLICLVVLHLAACVASAQSLPSPAAAEEQVANFVDEKVRDFKGQADELYNKQDKRSLLQKKESVDCFFLGPLLLAELANGQAFDVCRVLDYDYKPDKVLVDLPSPRVRELLDKNLRCCRLGEDDSLVFSMRVTDTPYVGALYPCVHEVEGRLSRQAAAIAVKRYEPELVNRELNFPVYPDGLAIRWDPRELVLYDGREGQIIAKEAMPAKPPLFNNPPGIYSLFDCLRLLPFLSSSPREQNGQQAAEGEACWEARTAQADCVRRQICAEFKEGCLARLTVRQSPVYINHVFYSTFQMQRLVGRQSVVEEYRPGSELTYLEGGRTIVIDFAARSKDDPASGVVPKELRVCRGDVVVHRTEFKRIEHAKGQGAVPECERLLGMSAAWHEADARLQGLYAALDAANHSYNVTYYPKKDLDQTSDVCVRGLMLKYNVYGALRAADMGALTAGLSEYRRFLDEQGYPAEMYLYGLESITQTAGDFCGDSEFIWQMANTALRSAYAECPSGRLRAHVCRLIDQYRFGPALIALDVFGASPEGRGALSRWVASTQTLVSGVLGGDVLEQPLISDYPYARQQMALGQLISARLHALNAGKKE